jgi:hypothetical protein
MEEKYGLSQNIFITYFKRFSITYFKRFLLHISKDFSRIDTSMQMNNSLINQVKLIEDSKKKRIGKKIRGIKNMVNDYKNLKRIYGAKMT